MKELHSGNELLWHEFPATRSMPSSVIEKYFYMPDSQRLRIVYRSGAVYDYLNVPEATFLRFKQFTSKGTFLNKYIKPNFKFEKIKER